MKVRTALARLIRASATSRGVRRSSFCDPEWYLASYPDVRETGMDPVDHYLLHGWREGRDPSLSFDTQWYLRQNPDVAAADMNPLLHYLRFGAREGRTPSPPQPMAGMPLIARHTGSRGITPSGALSEPSAVVDEVQVRRSLPPDAEMIQIGEALTNSTSAIAQLEAARASGASHLAIPASSARRITDHPAFSAHLARYPLAVDEETCAVYDIRTPGGTEVPSLTARLPRLIGEFRDRYGREPAILDCDTDVSLARHALGAEVFSPERRPDGTLPYADTSIDLVAVVDGDARSSSEADRVARSGVLSISGDGASASVSVRWLTEAMERLPSVSIVIPTFDRSAFVRACVRTLTETIPEQLDVEVVIVDDASTDDTPDVLSDLARRERRISVLRNATNLGFIGSVNRGADAADGEILVFLNNDTLALAGWLQPLLRTFRERIDTGAVGGKLVFPDGRLQEAGGIIFSDGSAANFGYGDTDPEAAPYSYIREVDYVSGALLATPRALFRDLGRFDPAFGFGYYEDGDYCFKLRRDGRRTYFRPDSVIVHRQGGTSGTDTSHGPKQYQVTNRRIFVDRWRADLRRQPNPPSRWRVTTLFDVRPPRKSG